MRNVGKCFKSVQANFLHENIFIDDSKRNSLGFIENIIFRTIFVRNVSEEHGPDPQHGSGFCENNLKAHNQRVPPAGKIF